MAAWVRLRVPSPPETLVLMGSLPMPPSPPLDLLVPEPVSSDPRKRLFAWEGRWQGGVVRLRWDADAAGLLDAEYRIPERRRIAPKEVRAFWEEVKRRVTPLGPLVVESADPWP